MSALINAYRRLTFGMTPWPRRLQRIGQVCEMALVNVELYCKVRARLLADAGQGPQLIVQLETDAFIPPDVLLDVQCYLARNMNEVLGMRATLRNFAVLVINSEVAITGGRVADIPHVATRLLAQRLAPLMLNAGNRLRVAAGTETPSGAANDSRLSALRPEEPVAGSLQSRSRPEFDGRLAATQPMVLG
jgi:hypothetical protein